MRTAQSRRAGPVLVLLFAMAGCGALVLFPRFSVASTPLITADASRRESSSASLTRPTHATTTPALGHENPRLLPIRRCLELADTDVLAAIESALAQNLCADDPGLLPSLLGRWAREDFTGAHAWLRAQEPAAWRDDLLARLAFFQAQNDPLAAARLVLADIRPGPARDEAIISVVHQWARRDAEAARLWAKSLPDAPLSLRAMQEIE